MTKHKNKIIAGVIIAAILAFAFWYGGDTPGLNEKEPPGADVTSVIQDETQNQSAGENEKNIDDTSGNGGVLQKTDAAPTPPEEKTVPDEADEPAVQYSEKNGMEIDSGTGRDKYQTEPVPVGKPVPIEPENTVISDKELTCTLSVRCDTVLENMLRLDKDKISLIPPDGVIFAEKTVTFYDGESVFNVLLREMKRNRIHMEFENTPIYNSAYIEGIANLYEFDCGELSGWMYKVNGWFPNYGCSRYRLKAGDKIEWVYTCDLGADVGGNYSARNGK